MKPQKYELRKSPTDRDEESAGKSGEQFAGKSNDKPDKRDVEKKAVGREKNEVIETMKAGPVAGGYTIVDIKRKFHSLDLNGDGILSFDEMHMLLCQGREDISEKELALLWNDMNHDGDEGIDFDEFVDYLFRQYESDDKKMDWKGAKKVFHAITDAAGRNHMIHREFMDLCGQLELFDDTGFGVTEAEALFKTCKGGARGLTFDRFQTLVKKISKTKNVPVRTIVNWIASYLPGRANEDILTSRRATAKTIQYID